MEQEGQNLPELQDENRANFDDLTDARKKEVERLEKSGVSRGDAVMQIFREQEEAINLLALNEGISPGKARQILFEREK